MFLVRKMPLSYLFGTICFAFQPNTNDGIEFQFHLPLKPLAPQLDLNWVGFLTRVPIALEVRGDEHVLW